MAPLTQDVQRSKTIHDLRLVPLPVKAATKIFTGGLVCVQTADGLSIPAADAAGLRFAGVAHRGFDNSAGSAGVVDGFDSARYCEVDVNGPYSFAVSGATPKPGEDAHVVDDNTVAVAGGVNDVKCGIFTEPDPGTPGNWFVDIERAF